jgi:hypothetical protein
MHAMDCGLCLLPLNPKACIEDLDTRTSSGLERRALIILALE